MKIMRRNVDVKGSLTGGCIGNHEDFGGANSETGFQAGFLVL